MSCDLLFVAYYRYRRVRLWASRISDVEMNTVWEEKGAVLSFCPLPQITPQENFYPPAHIYIKEATSTSKILFILTALRYKKNEVHRKFS